MIAGSRNRDLQQVPGKDRYDDSSRRIKPAAVRVFEFPRLWWRCGFAADPVAANHGFGICDFLFAHGNYAPCERRTERSAFFQETGVPILIAVASVCGFSTGAIFSRHEARIFCGWQARGWRTDEQAGRSLRPE